MKPLLRSLLWCGMVVPALLWGQAARSQAPSAFAGSDACQPCHEDMYPSIEASGHGDLLESRHPGRRGCESCHGAGAEHIQGNGDAGKIFRFSQATADLVRARCSQCHQDLMSGDTNHQQRSCLDCHSAHHYQQKRFLLNTGKEQLCQRCHAAD